MNETKQIVILAASPKPAGKAASDLLAARAAQTLGDERTQTSVLNVGQALTEHRQDEAFALMAAADAMVIVFPLYVFCLPGMLMRFLQGYQAYAQAHPKAKSGAAVYAVVNCGFPEPEINEEAVGVVGRFAAAVGARFGYGIMIGSGGMITSGLPSAHKMLAEYDNALARIKAETASGACEPAPNVCLRVSFPVGLYNRMVNIIWRIQIRKHGKRQKDLYARPYQE
ncbi:MAG TPA: NAD(P)H-dependent oxidoreductase [Candidatus Limiplasma sp.]|nr:NAD(P)H-dependent oxidoreductase [Candidatus Limiplasma sp.]